MRTRLGSASAIEIAQMKINKPKLHCRPTQIVRGVAIQRRMMVRVAGGDKREEYVGRGSGGQLSANSMAGEMFRLTLRQGFGSKWLHHEGTFQIQLGVVCLCAAALFLTVCVGAVPKPVSVTKVEYGRKAKPTATTLQK